MLIGKIYIPSSQRALLNYKQYNNGPSCLGSKPLLYGCCLRGLWVAACIHDFWLDYEMGTLTVFPNGIVVIGS